jgi:hypothetical protein
MADASDLDGYWGGQVKFRGGFGVEVFLTSSQGFSELKIRNSSGFGFLNQVRANQAVFPDEYLLTDADMTLCEYFIKNSSAGEVKELVLNTDLSRNVNCPREPEISLDREADKIAVSITSDKLTAKLQIFSNYRPLKKEELGTLPSGFDVLGVTVGTAEHEARKILEDRGFRELDVAEQYVLETNTWSQQALNFVKGDIRGDQNLPSFSDHVLLVLNTEVIGTSEPRHVVYLARKRDYGAHGEAGTDFSGLLEALTKKHGITVGGFETRPTRNYTFEGENISGLNDLSPRQYFASCARESMQAIDYQHSTNAGGDGFGTSKVQNRCGSQVAIQIRQQGNIVDWFSVKLTSRSHLYADSWVRQSDSLAQRIAGQFAKYSISEEAQEAPEL